MSFLIELKKFKEIKKNKPFKMIKTFNEYKNQYLTKY